MAGTANSKVLAAVGDNVLLYTVSPQSCIFTPASSRAHTFELFLHEYMSVNRTLKFEDFDSVAANGNEDLFSNIC